ncbi:hypothetical protein BFV96_4308 [Alteromonas macleodii]|nr:hypothetical protein BFV93_4808 [Alteromonas macleodii]OES39160.1 hypothetical protein BFV96_4308 [Alteromonas macleodii]
MGVVLCDSPVKFQVPQKTHCMKTFAISEQVTDKVRTVCKQRGVSQVNFIYTALMWQIALSQGAQTA